MNNNKEKKILIISAVFPPEPVVSAKLSFDIAKALSENNKVTVIVPKPSRPFGFQFTGETLNFDFNHIQVDSFICASSRIIGRFRESYSFGKHCYKYIADNHQYIDVIYANTWPLLGQYFAVKAAREYNIPIILHVQDIYPESLSRKLSFVAFLINGLLIPLDKYILSNSTKVIAISEKMKKHLMLIRSLPDDKIDVIRNWQDETAFFNLGQCNPNSLFTFLYLGNISPSAGVELLIHGFNKANLKNAQLIIAGNGSDLENCIKISDHYENKNIHFIDAPSDLVPTIQTNADVLMLPLKKGIGLTASPSKLASYMFSSKPIIACVDDTSDTANSIRHANCGWVVPPEDVDKLANLMVQVRSTSIESLQILGLNGYVYSLANYSKKKNLEKLLSIIESEYKA